MLHYNPDPECCNFHSVSKWFPNLRSNTKPIIVATHHLPSYRLIDEKYKDCGINSAFDSSTLSTVLHHANVWLCGHHTHTPKNATIGCNGAILLSCNPIGYEGENKDVHVKTLNRK